MTAAASTADQNNLPSNYHTVPICSDLPKIDNCYSDQPIKDLPPADYWTTKIDKHNDKDRYKLRHVIANGPCEW